MANKNKNDYNYIYDGLNTYHYSVKEKERNVNTQMRYMLARTRRMFKWEGLPDTIPERDLELLLQRKGHCFITKVNGELYALNGSLGGKPNPYYMPTEYIVANPALNYSANLEIDKDGIVIPNNSLYDGLIPIFAKYLTLLSEADISLNNAAVLARASLIFTADEERQAAGVRTFLSKIEDGDIGVITAEKSFSGEDTVAVQPSTGDASGSITNLIELVQYYKATLWNELGLNSNWNAKRETLTSSETMLNTDPLTPLIDDMLLCRQEQAEKINNMFGTQIRVEFNSAWLDNEIEEEMQLEQQEEFLEGGDEKDEEPQEDEKTEEKDDEGTD